MAKRTKEAETERRTRQKQVAARIVLVTCESQAQAEKIATAVIERRLAACVNILSAPVNSIYRWKNKVQAASEVLLIIKTTAPRLKALEQAVAAIHSYEVPEFLVVAVAGGSRAYLNWIAEST